MNIEQLTIEKVMINNLITTGLLKYSLEFLIKNNYLNYRNFEILLIDYIKKNKNSILSNEYNRFKKSIDCGKKYYNLIPYGNVSWRLNETMFLTIILDLEEFYMEIFEVLKNVLEPQELLILLKFNRLMIKEPFKTIKIRNTQIIRNILKFFGYKLNFNGNYFGILQKETYKSLEDYANKIIKKEPYLYKLNDIRVI